MLPRPHCQEPAEVLFARRLIGPDSPLDDGEYVGEYMGGEDITPAELQRYMLDPTPDKQTAYMITFQGGYQGRLGP